MSNHISKQHEITIVTPLQFERCWEISTLHISEAALEFLQKAIIDKTDYDNLMFNLFLFPGVIDNCIAVKLLATPWTDKTLLHAFDFNHKNLIDRQMQAELPACFINILNRAAQMDVRILIFDPHADPIVGLAVYDY